MITNHALEGLRQTARWAATFLFCCYCLLRPSHAWGGYSTLGSELATGNTATEPVVTGGDTNATTGWVTNSGTLSSVSSAPSDGAYHFSFLATGNGGAFATDLNDTDFLSAALVDGNWYKATFMAKNLTDEPMYIGPSSSKTTGPNANIQFATLSINDLDYKAYSIYWYQNAATTITDQKTAAFRGAESGPDNNAQVYFDKFSVKLFTPDLGAELDTASNGSNPTADSANTTGWTNTGFNTFESVGTGTPHSGSYHMHFVAGDNIDRASFDLSPYMAVGSQYLISFWVKHNSGTAASIRLGATAGTSGSNLVATSAVMTSYTKVQYIITYSTSLRFLNVFEDGASNNADLSIDDLSIMAVSSETPSNPTITISAAESNASENAITAGSFVISCTPNCAGETVNYTVTGTGTDGTDYVSMGTSKVVTGASGVITVAPIQDAILESTETVVVTITSGTGYIVGSGPAATVNIADNDSTGLFYVSNTGAGAQDGSSASNAWAGVPSWTSLYAGQTLRITDCIHNKITWPITTGGLTDDYLTVEGTSAVDSGIVLGNEVVDSIWIGPDAFGAYQTSYSTTVSGAIEWTTSGGPCASNTKLTDAGRVPDLSWTSGSFYYDSPNTTVYWKPAGSATGKTVTFNASLQVQMSGVSWVKVSNLKHSMTGYDVGRTVASHHVWLDHLTISSVSGIAIRVNFDRNVTGSDYGKVTNSTISDAGNGIYILADSTAGHSNDYWEISGNTVTDMHDNADAHCIGIQVGEYNVIANNDLSYCNTGITMWSADAGVMNHNVISNNYIHNIEGSRGDGRGHGIEWSGGNAGADGNYRDNYTGYNVIADCDGTGMRLKFKDPLNYVYNNVVRNCVTNYSLVGMGTSYPQAATIENNVSINPTTWHWQIPTFTNQVYTGLTLDGNTYFPIVGSQFKLYTTNYDFIGWQDALLLKNAIGAESLSQTVGP